MLKKYGKIFITLFICSDILLLFFVWVFSYILAEYFSSGRFILTEDFWRHIRIFVIFALLFLFSAQSFDFYAPRRFNNYYSELFKVFKSLLFSCLLFFSLGYFAGILRYNHIFLLMSFGLSVGLIFTYHALLNFILKHFRAKGFNLRKILIVGGGELAKKSALKFLEHHEFGLNVIGFLCNSANEPAAGITGIPVLGKYNELNKVVSQEHPDIVFFALAPKEERLTRFLVGKINNELVDIKIALDTNGVFLLKNSFSEIDGIPVISLRENRLFGFEQIVKRVLDFILALIIILLVAPVFALVGICIKFSSRGRVFYIQERASLGGKKFNLIKFRTMEERAEDNTGPVWATENDPRRTKFGALLRRVGLDELPQFINVLKGEMSIVGPRPERPELIEEFKKLYPHYMLRHAVRAGITGWAQVNGLRGNTPLRKRIEYDFYYIENMSLWFDVKVIFMTIPEILRGRGAY